MAAEGARRIDPKAVVAIFYVAAVFVVGLFLEKVLELVFSYAKWDDPVLLSGIVGWNLTTVIGFGLAVVAALGAWQTPRVRTVSMEVAQELKNVTWPTMRETRAATVAVVAATFVATVILGSLDLLWGALSKLVLGGQQ